MVALTVNLGQPGEDYEVVEGKALRLGALDCHVVDAREEFAREFVAAGHQGQRGLRRRLPALHRARPPADRQARRRVRPPDGLRHDRPRLHGQGQRPGPDRVAPSRRSRPSSRSSRPCARGRWGATRRSPTRASTASRSRAGRRPRRTPSTTTSGAARPRASGSRTSRTRPTTTSSSSSRGPSSRPTRRRWSTVEFEAGVPVALNGERLGLVELIDRAAELGMRHGVGIVDHIEDRIVGLKVRDIYEVPAAAILLKAHRELERLCGTIHQNQFKPRARPALGLPRLRGAVVGAAAGGHRGLRRARQPAGDGHDRVQALQGLGAGGHARERRTRSTTRSSPPSPSPAACSPSRRRRGSSSCGGCSRAWRARRFDGEGSAMGYKLLGDVVWNGGKRVLQRKYGRDDGARAGAGGRARRRAGRRGVPAARQKRGLSGNVPRPDCAAACRHDPARGSRIAAARARRPRRRGRRVAPLRRGRGPGPRPRALGRPRAGRVRAARRWACGGAASCGSSTRCPTCASAATRRSGAAPTSCPPR